MEAARSAHAKGLGVLIDIVPNHMGVATPAKNAWWWDVLQHGRGSRYASAFDIDWDFGSGKVRIPVLGDGDALADLTRLGGGPSSSTSTTGTRSRRARRTTAPTRGPSTRGSTTS